MNYLFVYIFFTINLSLRKPQMLERSYFAHLGSRYLLEDRKSRAKLLLKSKLRGSWIMIVLIRS